MPEPHALHPCARRTAVRIRHQRGLPRLAVGDHGSGAAHRHFGGGIRIESILGRGTHTERTIAPTPGEVT